MSDRTPQELAAAINVPGIRRHVLLCTAADCDADRTAWQRLRQEVREQGVRREVHLTEASCLGVCEGGPTAVVHPDGTWYRGMDADRVPEFVARHLVAGGRVEDLVVVEAPLQG